MNIQQLWLIISTIVSVLLLTVVIVTSIVGFIYIISTIIKNKLIINKQEQWYEIAVAGSIILVTGQLIGALCGVMFPIFFGLDSSDFSISVQPNNFGYEYNAELNEYHDNMTWTNGTSYLIFTTKIYANNLHPLRDYNHQIYLEVLTPNGISYSTGNFTITVGSDTVLYIYTYNKAKLYPGRYPITIRGIGGDGKSRECKLFLDIYSISQSSNKLTNVSLKTTDDPLIWIAETYYNRSGSRLEPTYADIKELLGNGLIGEENTDCGQKAAFVEWLLERHGIRSNIVIADNFLGKNYSHAWVEVTTDTNGSLFIDLTESPDYIRTENYYIPREEDGKVKKNYRVFKDIYNVDRFYGLRHFAWWSTNWGQDALIGYQY